MRRRIPSLLAALTGAAWSLAAAAEPLTAAIPGALGVQVEKPAGDHMHFSQGSGVYLGGGLVLTAAHVVKYDPQVPDASVIMDGWKTGAKVVASGAPGLDLALLRIAPAELSAARRDLPPVKLCAAPTAANQPVVVAAEGQVSLSRTVGAPVHSTTLNGDWTTILATGYPHGASGGGVFDAQAGCLAGIIIIEATGPGVAFTEFIPSAKIAPFVAAELSAAGR